MNTVCKKIIFSWIYDYAISGKIIKYVDVYNNFFNEFTIIIYISVEYFSCYKTVKGFEYTYLT